MALFEYFDSMRCSSQTLCNGQILIPVGLVGSDKEPQGVLQDPISSLSLRVLGCVLMFNFMPSLSLKDFQKSL
jgi:hypothetical protein